MEDRDYPTPEDNGWQLTDDGRGVAMNLLRGDKSGFQGQSPGGVLGATPLDDGLVPLSFSCS